MRALIQRVSHASVKVDQKIISNIGKGLLILLGVGHGDGEEQAAFLAEKIANLRIFEDEQGKTNLSVLDVKGEAIVVSQFTLYADLRKGRRPSFTDAASPEVAEPLVNRFAELLRVQGVPTQTGQFGAHMLVEIHNDGPVTIWLEKSGDPISSKD
ncbi:MAG TPA: D-aminoacyl-tRNA deacylase [Anaerolineales bacterium]|nr:D-aminoacyl-tRNA deacylase [Anaerolineales bacterium]